MKQLVQRFNAAIDQGMIKAIFDHVRNFLYASIFLAAGSYSARYDNTALFGLIVSENLGFGIIAIGVIFMMLNLYAGIYGLSKRKYPVILSIIMGIIYVLASVRIVEVMWSFRDNV